MALPPGAHFGVHGILTPTGSGGLGEVYRANRMRFAMFVLPRGCFR